MTWGSLALGEVIEIKHGWAFDGKCFASEGELVLLTPGNVWETGGLKLRGDQEKYYSGEFPEEFLLHKGDMLVVMTDLKPTAPILGASLMIPEDNRFLHNQRLGLVGITDPSRMDSKFLYYIFNTPTFRGQVRGSATGATVRHTAPGRICACRVPAPLDVAVQRRIAAILSAYDDLIENNRRRIQLLEEAARLIYQEWFVRLRFPGHERVRVVDGVPEGWGRRQLSALCDEIRDTVRANRIDPTSPYIGLEHMPRRSITLSDWGAASEVQSDKHAFRKGDILFGKIRPYFHKVGVCLTDGVASTDAIVIRPRTRSLFSLVLMTVSSDLFVAHATQSSHGSKMPRANWKVLERFPVLVPSESSLRVFSTFIDPIVSELRTLALTNRKLQDARDLLLPRLMSGQIEV